MQAKITPKLSVNDFTVQSGDPKNVVRLTQFLIDQSHSQQCSPIAYFYNMGLVGQPP